MTISPINNVNNIRNLSFGETKEKPDTEKKSQISTQTKVIVGTGLAALAAVGIYITTKGKGSKTITSGLNSASGDEKPLEILKEYTIDAFKKAGHKFEKGKAITSDGKNYTGTLIRTDKNGNKFVSEFKDGVFQKATKNNDIISEVTIKDNIKIIKTKKSDTKIDTNTGKILRLVQEGKGIKEFVYTKDGRLKYINFTNEEIGTSGVRGFTKFAPDGKTKMFTFIKDNGHAQIFDNKGNVIDKINVGDAKNLIKNKFYEYNGLTLGEDMNGMRYTFSNPEKEIKSAILSKCNKPGMGDNLRIISNDKPYDVVVEINTNKIFAKGKEITDKALAEQILARKNQILEQITSTDKKALDIISQLREGYRESNKADLFNLHYID